MHETQHPVPFGHWLLQGSRLTCRLPRRTATVQADGHVLRELLALCDGNRTRADVQQALARRWDSSSVDSLLAGLARAGLLVDRDEQLARWLDLGLAPGLHPPRADAAQVARLPRRSARRLLQGASPGELDSRGDPVARLIAQRSSQRTFDDRPLPAAALRSLAWAAGGVTCHAPGQLHRTIASGGNLHGLRWFAIVLRELPGQPAIPAGIHECRFHLDGGVSLKRIAGGPSDAWHLLRDPRVLRYASAMLLPVADLSASTRKYGNRAVVFAHLEAGAALQNVQLMAPALGAAACLRGDLDAGFALHLLAPVLRGLDVPPVAMPPCVLGLQASAAQLAAQAADGWLQLTPLDRGRGGAGAYAAGPVAHAGLSVHTTGRSTQPALAATKAQAEAWERLAWLHPGAGLVVAEGRELPGAVNPSSLVAYAPRQHRRAGFPFVAHDPAHPRLWRAGHEVLGGRAAHVPAECVHALASLPARWQRRPLTNASTSGVAAWTDPDGALERATLELVERDAFLRAWIGHQAPPRIRQASLPAEAARRIRALESGGHTVDVLRLPSAWAPVYAALVRHRTACYTGVTASAGFDPAQALAKALDEAEGRAGHAAACSPPGPRRVADVRTPRDIHGWWQTPRSRGRADFLAAGVATPAFLPDATTCRDWPSLRCALAQAGRQLIAVDITPEGAALDQGRTRLHVVRAFVPGLLPIWFEHGTEPAGLPAYRQAAGARASRPMPLHPFA